MRLRAGLAKIKPQPLLPLIQVMAMAISRPIPPNVKPVCMNKKTPAANTLKTKTTVNKTAALHAADAHQSKNTKQPAAPAKAKVPVVKDIDESSLDRK